MKSKSNKKIIIFVISIIVLILIIVGIISSLKIYDYKIKEKEYIQTKGKEYILEKYLSTDIELDQNSELKINNGITFIKNSNQLKIYNQEGIDVTPSILVNENYSIQDFIKDDNFYGYIITSEGQGYYINNQGEVAINLKTSFMTNIDEYLRVDTDEICHTINFNGYENINNCQNIYDLNGKLLIDGKTQKYYNISKLHEIDNTIYLHATNKEKTGIIDINNNIIIDFKYDYFTYNEELKLIVGYKNNNSIVDIYDVTGKLLKTVTLTKESLNKNTASFGSTIDNTINFYFNDNIHLINNNYELKEYKNVYSKETPGAESNGKLFYITNSIYIQENNGIYTVHNLEGKQIIDEEFKYIGNANSYGISEIGVPDDYILLCLNKDQTNCGAIDYNGNILLNFENELYYSEYFNGFKNNNQYFNIESNKITNKLTCDNFNLYINNYIDNIIIVEANSKRGIIDLNCNRLSEFKYLNINKYNNYLVAEQKNSYDVYDKDAKLINYQNEENATLTYFLGYDNNNLYFGSNNNIYVLKEK